MYRRRSAQIPEQRLRYWDVAQRKTRLGQLDHQPPLVRLCHILPTRLVKGVLGPDLCGQSVALVHGS